MTGRAIVLKGHEKILHVWVGSDDPDREVEEIALLGADGTDQAVADIVAYVFSGVVNPTAIEEPLADWMARGRVPNCTCECLQCVCEAVKGHTKECRFRIAMTCAIPIKCEHREEVCMTCDACTCGAA
jgi:hypothetical protein